LKQLGQGPVKWTAAAAVPVIGTVARTEQFSIAEQDTELADRQEALKG